MKVVSRLLLSIVLLGMIVAWSGASVATLAAAPTLPPTWTPEPTPTPFVEPTVAPLPTEAEGATLVPTITPRAPLREDLFITAPLYYISKRFSDTKYIALALPNEGDFRKLVKIDGENILAFDVCKDGKLIYATDKGEIWAAGHPKAWRRLAPSEKPLLVSTIACSPDSKTIAFSLHASDDDFALMSKAPTSGIYLWGTTGDPQLVLPDSDKTAEKLRANYELMSWSPDGQQLLVSFSQGANKPSDGLGLWTVDAKDYREAFRYASTDKLRYKEAIWLRDGSAVLLYNLVSPDINVISPISHINLSNGTRSVIGLYRPKATTHDGTPDAVSAIRFLPDGRVMLLGALRGDKNTMLREQPLQIFVGRYDSGLRMDVDALGLAFRLKWPGVLLVPPTGFPLFVLDKQFGIEMFNSGRTIAFLPQEMRMGSLNNTDAFGDEFYPSYRFGPAEPILPIR